MSETNMGEQVCYAQFKRPMMGAPDFWCEQKLTKDIYAVYKVKQRPIIRSASGLVETRKIVIHRDYIALACAIALENQT